MTIEADCRIAEERAGAIAIGEASDLEREAYRRHLAVCERCVRELGGEREIERVIATVARARDDESWEPTLRPVSARHAARRFGWAWAGALAASVALFATWRILDVPRSAPVHTLSALETRSVAALGTETTSQREGRAESLVVGGRVLTASVNVSVDGRGKAVRCSIVKTSGDRALDDSLCRAALHAHTP